MAANQAGIQGGQNANNEGIPEGLINQLERFHILNTDGTVNAAKMAGIRIYADEAAQLQRQRKPGWRPAARRERQSSPSPLKETQNNEEQRANSPLHQMRKDESSTRGSQQRKGDKRGTPRSKPQGEKRDSIKSMAYGVQNPETFVSVLQTKLQKAANGRR